MPIAIRTAAIALLAFAALATPAAASSINGELCSVTSLDGSIRASVYEYPRGVVTQAALNAAGAWCTNQTQVPGWIGADKSYDSWIGQTAVCAIHMPYAPVSTVLYADPAAYAGVLLGAEQDCRDIVGGNPYAVVLWYPTTN